MGNTVCSDSTPIAFEDLRELAKTVTTARASGSRGGRSASATGILPTIPADVKSKFTPYLHNLKCWSFGFDSNSSAVNAMPFRLDQSAQVDPRRCYLILHLERVQLSSVKKSSSTSDLSGGEEIPVVQQQPQSSVWATELVETFTPRGVKEPSSVDLLSLRWRHIPTDATHKYGFTLYALNGKEAETLVVATAMARSYELEGILHKNPMLHERLFFNDLSPLVTASATAGEGGVSVDPMPVGANVTLQGGRRSAGNPHSPGLLAERVALFRKILRLSPVTKPPIKPQENIAKLDELIEAPKDGRGPSVATARTASETPSTDRQQQESSRGETVDISRPVPKGFNLAIPKPAAAAEEEERAAVEDEDGDVATSDDGEDDEEEEHAATSPVPKIGGVKFSGLGIGGSQAAAGGSPNSTQDGEDQGERSHISKDPTTARGTTLRPVDSGINFARKDEEPSADEVEADRVRRIKESAPVATTILDHLFVGGEIPALDKEYLVGKGITHVVNCGAIAIPSKYTDVFTYDSLFLGDSPDEEITPFFPQIIKNIEEEVSAREGKTYVHCHQGVSRSVSFVLAYMMWKHGFCYDEAFKDVKQKRTVASPNAGFYVSLLGFERWLSDPLAVVSSASGGRGGLVIYRYQAFRPGSFMGPLAYNLVYPPLKKSQAQQLKRNAAGDAEVEFDSRACYLVFDVAGPADQEVFFIEGTDAPEAYASEARSAVDVLLQYGFYSQSKARSSINGKNEDVEFNPSSLYESATVTLLKSDESPTTLENKFSSGCGVAFATSSATEEYDVFASADLVPYIKDEVLTARSRGVFESSARNSARTRIRSEMVEPLEKARDGASAATGSFAGKQEGHGGGSAASGGGENSVTGDGATADDSEELVDGGDFDPLTVLALDDLDNHCEDIYGLEDLEPDRCYAVIHRKTTTSRHGNLCFIWRGAEAPDEPQDLIDLLVEQWMKDGSVGDRDDEVGCAWRVAQVVGAENIIVEEDQEESNDFLEVIG